MISFLFKPLLDAKKLKFMIVIIIKTVILLRFISCISPSLDIYRGFRVVTNCTFLPPGPTPRTVSQAMSIPPATIAPPTHPPPTPAPRARSQVAHPTLCCLTASAARQVFFLLLSILELF